MTNFTENNLVDAEITEGKRIKMNYICCISYAAYAKIGQFLVTLDR